MPAYSLCALSKTCGTTSLDSQSHCITRMCHLMSGGIALCKPQTSPSQKGVVGERVYAVQSKLSQGEIPTIVS